MIDFFNFISPFYLNGNIFTSANIFMIVLAVLWLIVASILDFRKREVENWWSFSLIIFVLAFRAFLSIESSNYLYLAWGLVGLIVGFGLCNLFYYGRMFGGGDAKFLMALGVILPLSLDWMVNLYIFVLFLLILLFAGAVYGLVYCLVLTIINFRKFKSEFLRQFKKNSSLAGGIFLLSIILIILFWFMGFWEGLALSGILFLSPFLLIYARAIENSCMEKLVDVDGLTIGDLLVKPIKIKGKNLNSNWEGLSERQLKLIQKNYKQKVLIRYGIPFMPAFLIAILVLLWMLEL